MIKVSHGSAAAFTREMNASHLRHSGVKEDSETKSIKKTWKGIESLTQM